MKNIYTITLAAFFTTSIVAQVGIGTTSPNTNSILDLTNSNNKVLVLPTTSTPASSSIGNVYFNTIDSTLNYSNGISYNALSAWKFKYNGNNNLYTTQNVGIGVSMPQAKLHLKGVDGANFMVFEGSTSDLIKVAINSGNIEMSFDNTNGKLNVEGEINAKNGKVQESGYDLIPQGLISMWSGNTIPAGWVLCDGGTYLGVVTPDLRERFIVGAGSINSANTVMLNANASITHQAFLDNDNVGGALDTQYMVNSTGGEIRHVLSEGEMPVHTHPAGNLGGTTSLNGAHSHTMNARIRGNEDGPNDYTWAQNGSADRTTNSAGAHTHTLSITGNTGSNGSNTAHENRPPYYALAFIMKL